MICPRCDGLLREDTQFTAEMRLYDLWQRRYFCPSGHSVYVGLPVLEMPRLSARAPVKLPNPGRTTERACPQCGDSFHGSRRQKFCSSICTRAADTERNRRYPKGGRKMVGEELRLVRAMPRPWNSWKRNQTAPVPYAPRPKNLDRTWA